MAFEKGNQVASKDKLMRQAMINVFDKHPQGRMAAMMEIAEPLIALAKSGDIQAAREVVDRIDGKSHQSSDVSVSGSLQDTLASIAAQAVPE